jgi:mRNA interferase MazF
MARRILRGSIYWADLNPTQGKEQSGIRPVLVTSHSSFNDNSEMAIVMAITSSKPKASYPLTLELECPKLPKRSWVKTTQIRAISTSRLKTKIGNISETQMEEVIKALCEVIS